MSNQNRQFSSMELENLANGKLRELSNILNLLHNGFEEQNKQLQNMRIEIEKLKNPPKEKK